MAQPLPYCASILTMEAQATIQGIYPGFSTSFTSFVVESDSQSISYKVQANEPNLFPVGGFVWAIRNSLSFCLSTYNSPFVYNLVIVKYASRSTNAVTDSLAHMNSMFSVHRIWFNDFPC